MGSDTEAASSSERVQGAKFAIGDAVVLLRCERLYAGTVTKIEQGEAWGWARYRVQVAALEEELLLGESEICRDDGIAPAIRNPEQLAAEKVTELLQSKDCRALPKSVRGRIERILREEVMLRESQAGDSRMVET